MVSREARDAATRDEAARNEAARSLALAQRELVRLPIVAPRAGVVVRRTVEPGAQAAEAAELLAIAPLNSIVFEAHVTAQRRGMRTRARRHRSRVRARPRARPRCSACCRWRTARIRRRSVARARAVPRPGARRFGTAVHRGRRASALGVPDSAVVEDDLTGQHRIVVVGTDGRVAWVTVTQGAIADGWRELSGAAQGGCPGGDRRPARAARSHARPGEADEVFSFLWLQRRASDAALAAAVALGVERAPHAGGDPARGDVPPHHGGSPTPASGRATRCCAR